MDLEPNYCGYLYIDTGQKLLDLATAEQLPWFSLWWDKEPRYIKSTSR